MKRIMIGIRGLLGLVVLGTGIGVAEPQLIAEWDFNEPNRWEASQGNGKVSLLGGVQGTNFTGSANDPGKPNGALSLRAFPAQGIGSRTAGLELEFPGGWRGLQISFEVRTSGTASRHLAALIAREGEEFQEFGAVELAPDGVFIPITLPGPEDFNGGNPAPLRLRLVSDLSSTGEYVGVKPKSDGANSYSPAGTWRFDRIQVWGEPWEASESVRLECVSTLTGPELRWNKAGSSSFTVWRSGQPGGPWEWLGEVEDPVWPIDLDEDLDEDARFFRVTSP